LDQVTFRVITVELACRSMTVQSYWNNNTIPLVQSGQVGRTLQDLVGHPASLLVEKVGEEKSKLDMFVVRFASDTLCRLFSFQNSSRNLVLYLIFGVV
jgi:hypothetical protein